VRAALNSARTVIVAADAALRLLRDASAPRSPSNWLMRIPRWLKAASLSPVEQELLAAARHAALVVGAPVLSAGSVDELNERLDEQVQSAALISFIQRTTELTTLDVIIEFSRQQQPTPAAMIDALGDGPASIIAKASKLEAAALSALVQMLPYLGPDAVANGTREFVQEYSRALYSSEIPSTIQRGILSGMRSSVAGIAIGHALFSARRLDPWMAQHLAQSYRDGLFQYVRVLAAFPFVNIPEEVLSLDERLDLRALEVSHSAATEAIDLLAVQAEAAGGSLVAVPDDP